MAKTPNTKITILKVPVVISHEKTLHPSQRLLHSRVIKKSCTVHFISSKLTSISAFRFSLLVGSVGRGRGRRGRGEATGKQRCEAEFTIEDTLPPTHPSICVFDFPESIGAISRKHYDCVYLHFSKVLRSLNFDGFILLNLFPYLY